MFLAGLALSLLIALLRGGRFHNLLRLPLRYEGLVVVAFALRFLLQQAGLRGAALESQPWVVPTVQALAYATLLLAVVLNRRLPGVPTVGLGVLMNAAVILANAGRMPVSLAAARAVGSPADVERLVSGASVLHQVLAPGARLAFLGDLFTLPQAVPLRAVFSPGDAVILIGLFVLIQHAMLSRDAGAPVRRPVARG